VLSNVKFEEIMAAARDVVTRASRTVMRALGIKSGRTGDESECVKQATANDSCSSDGFSIQPPQVSVSTSDTVDHSPDDTIDALPEPSLNSDLKDELTRVLSGEELDHDLDARTPRMRTRTHGGRRVAAIAELAALTPGRP
jgi:hypothetical protein